MLDGSGAVEEDANLSAGIRGNFGQRASEVVIDDAIGLDAPAREAFEGFDLAGFEAGGVAVDLNGVLLLLRLRSPGHDARGGLSEQTRLKGRFEPEPGRSGEGRGARLLPKGSGANDAPRGSWRQLIH